MKAKYSVVIPMYNEEEVIAESYRRLKSVMDKVDESYELIFVNDGSRDKTIEMLRDIQKKDATVRIVDFARNFGHQIAVTAGLSYASGQAVLVIDADLQDPPEVMLNMIEKWKQGYEVVYGKRLERQGESFFKKISAKMFYRILNQLTEGRVPQDTGDFRLMDRKVVDVMNGMKEKARFLRGMVAWVGYKQIAEEFVREERFAGVTKYPLKKMLKLAMDGIMSFSYKPLKWPGYFGSFLCVASAVYALVWMILQLTNVIAPSFGFEYAFSAVFFLIGVVLLSQSILGAYVGRIYEEAKNRPLFTVRETFGFDE